MHDKNGRLINVGDKVILEGIVTGGLTNDGTYCSVEVELDGDWDGKGNKGKNWFSAKQVEVVDPKISSLEDTP